MYVKDILHSPNPDPKPPEGADSQSERDFAATRDLRALRDLRVWAYTSLLEKRVLDEASHY